MLLISPSFFHQLRVKLKIRSLIQFAFSFQCSWLFSEVYSVGSCYSVHCGLPYSYSFLCSLFVGRGVLISILFWENKRLSHSISCYCSKRYICVSEYPPWPMKYSFKIVWNTAYSVVTYDQSNRYFVIYRVFFLNKRIVPFIPLTNEIVPALYSDQSDPSLFTHRPMALLYSTIKTRLLGVSFTTQTEHLHQTSRALVCCWKNGPRWWFRVSFKPADAGTD